MRTKDFHEMTSEPDALTKNKWQKHLNLFTESTGVPLVFISRNAPSETKVLLSSGIDSENIRAQWNDHNFTFALCESVALSKNPLSIEDISQDKRWNKSAELSIGYRSLLGYPILDPAGDVYGTVCAMDQQASNFTQIHKALLEQVTQIIQDDLDKTSVEKERDILVDEIERYKASFQEADKHFMSAFQSTPIGLVISSTTTGKVINVNSAFQDIFGYAKDEVLGKSATELNLYWDQTERNTVMQKLSKGENLNNHEMKMRTKNGEARTVLASLQKTTLSGQPALITSIYDITALRKLENESMHLNERYVLATRAAQAGIWDWDIVNNILIWDDQMYSIYHATKDEFGGAYEAWLARIHPDDKEKADTDSKMAQTGDKEYDTEFRIRIPNGSTRFIKAYGDVIRDKSGVPLRMVGVNFDITDRKKLEQDLVESEQKYRDMFNQNSAVRIIIDVETGQLYDVNPAACSFYGYSRDQLLSMNVTVINGMPIREVLTILDMAFQKKRNYFQAKHRLANDDHRDVEIFNGPIVINNKKYLNCIVHDITERKQTEQKLIASEARYREVFENNSAAQILVNSDTLMVLDANAAALAFYGYTIEEFRTKSLWDINVTGENSISSKLGQTFSKGSNHFVTRHRRADQSIRDVEVFNGVIEVDGQKMVHAIIYDITESSKAILDLVESEGRFRQLIENAPNGIVVETDGKFAYVNQKAIDLFHVFSANDLIGTSFVDSFNPDRKAYLHSILTELNEGQKARVFCEETITRFDGGHVDVELSAVPFHYDGKNGALIYLNDMIERRGFEKAKAEMEWQLRQKQKLESIGTLAGGVAHEINNPINGIINYAELIAEGNITADQVKTFSQGIIHEGKRVADIVKNLLSFARQEKQTHSLAQIADIINQSVSLMQVMLRHDQITLELDIPEGLPSIKCRSNQIQQVIMNLITNARDALNSKYPGYHENKIMRIDCRMFEREGRRWFKITVTDNGTGIPSEILERIFDPFFTTKPRDEGTGLGLSISHGIVKDHHGELYFDTKRGEYTKAILELPVDNGWAIEENQ